MGSVKKSRFLNFFLLVPTHKNWILKTLDQYKKFSFESIFNWIMIRSRGGGVNEYRYSRRVGGEHSRPETGFGIVLELPRGNEFLPGYGPKTVPDLECCKELRRIKIWKNRDPNSYEASFYRWSIWIALVARHELVRRANSIRNTTCQDLTKHCALVVCVASFSRLDL